MPPLKYRPAGQRLADSDACGTSRGYKRHHNRGEQACPACCAAEAQYREDLRLAPVRRAILAEAISHRRPRRTS